MSFDINKGKQHQTVFELRSAAEIYNSQPAELPKFDPNVEISPEAARYWHEVVEANQLTGETIESNGQLAGALRIIAKGEVSRPFGGAVMEAAGVEGSAIIFADDVIGAFGKGVIDLFYDAQMNQAA